MGGLVVRAMIARHPAVWQEICAHQGGRLVMLGTPNRGSHAITELLVGRSVLLRKLARLDIRNSRADLLRIIGRFPGVLAMLPVAHNDDDYFSERHLAGLSRPHRRRGLAAARRRPICKRPPRPAECWTARPSSRST